MKRKIIVIDEKKCNGCGRCLPDCPEGALRIIDGKARLVSELFCDGLGACVGVCPEGALKVEVREAEPYNEKKVMERIVAAGPGTIRAHLQHLLEHGEKDYYREAVAVLKEKGLPLPETVTASPPCACPGTAPTGPAAAGEPGRTGDVASQLGQWPVQLHLVSPEAAFFKSADVVLAADCTAFACGEFHQRFLKGRALAIACPKLDEGKDVYVAKLTALIDRARIRSLKVVIMEVPCCRGLLALAKAGLAAAGRKIPLEVTVIGLSGAVISEGPIDP